MKNFLALECATDICSVALMHNGQISQVISREPRSNARVLLPMIDELLATAQLSFKELDALHVSIGPGSFTGIRIGIAVVQGLAYGSGLPIHTWDTLELIAGAWFLQTRQTTPAKAQAEKKVIVALDARMGEVYRASYAWDALQDRPREVQPPTIESVADFEQTIKDEWQDNTHYGLGSGLGLINFSNANLSPQALPEARTMLELPSIGMNSKVVLTSAADLTPLYLRNEVTWKKRERIRS